MVYGLGSCRRDVVTRHLPVVRPAFAVIAVVVGFSLSGEMMFVAAAGLRAGCDRGVTFLLPPDGEIPRLEPHAGASPPGRFPSTSRPTLA